MAKYSTPSFVSASIASKTVSCGMMSAFSILVSKNISGLTGDRPAGRSRA
ncbi:hypothetical protein H1R20_g16352, partial [Candolleomyces eurysporus]